MAWWPAQEILNEQELPLSSVQLHMVVLASSPGDENALVTLNKE